MSGFEAFLLGLLQGVTEFLPISSSGHLVLAEYFLGLKETSLAFDVTLHLGTLLAVLTYFYRDWLGMLLALVPGRGDPGSRRLLWLLILATIPGALAGFLLEHAASTYFRSPWVVVCTLSGVALLLLLAEKTAKHVKDMGGFGVKESILVGLSQALAIVPGVSRSGITMTCALFLGFTREAAAKFSFLISAPIIAGAGAYELLKLWKHGGCWMGQEFAIGFASAAISGYLVIAFLMNFLKRHTFYPFVIYRILLAAVVVFVLVFSWGK